MFRRRQVPFLHSRHIAGHPYRHRNARRISGTAVGKRPQIPHVGLSGSRRALLVSPFPDGLEEGIWHSAAGLELARSNYQELSGSSARGESRWTTVFCVAATLRAARVLLRLIENFRPRLPSW